MPVPHIVLTIAAQAASKAVGLAKDPEVQKKAMQTAQKAWENKDEIKKAVDAASPLVQKVAEKSAAAGSKAAGFAGEAAIGVAKAASNATDSASAAMKASAERRAHEKELAEARQQLLQSATARMEAAAFEREWSKAIQSGGPAPLKSPGYFVIAVYKGKANNGKLHDYSDVFVARAEDMGASIHRHMSGLGNPDVYADMKYGRSMLVFAYPDFDFDDDNNETLCRFIVALRADLSYNVRAAETSGLVEVTGPSADVERAEAAIRSAFADSSVSHRELCHDGEQACVMRLRKAAE